MVCKGYTQVEGIDFEETYALVVRMGEIKMFLAFAIFKDFKVYQMDVKSTLLNGELKEEVYIEQQEGFKLKDYLNIVFILKKALYGLKQALRAWYGRLEKYLIDQIFQKGSIDNNLYFNIDLGITLIVAIYVEDILFGGNKGMYRKVGNEM